MSNDRVSVVTVLPFPSGCLTELCELVGAPTTNLIELTLPPKFCVRKQRRFEKGTSIVELLPLLDQGRNWTANARQYFLTGVGLRDNFVVTRTDVKVVKAFCRM